MNEIKLGHIFVEFVLGKGDSPLPSPPPELICTPPPSPRLDDPQIYHFQ